MSSNFYDTVVIGTEIGPLTAGALLAKRGFRVLVVGQNAKPERYPCFEFSFVKKPFMLNSAGSPIVQRFQNELGIGQLFKQATYTPRPIYQVVLNRARPEIYRDAGQTKAEIRREFPKMGTAVDDTFNRLGHVNGEIDKLFSNDLVIPPESFIEKREFVRSEVQNPFRQGTPTEILGEANLDEKFLDFLSIPVRFETAGMAPLPPLVRYRQMGGWLCDSLAIKDGRDGLTNLLLDQISACGGDHQLGLTVAEIITSKGKVRGLRMAGREETTSCQVVLCDMTPKQLAPLVSPSTWTKRFSALVDSMDEPALGYAVNLGVDSEVVPLGLAQTAFASFGSGLCDELLRIERIPQSDKKLAALNVSCVVPPKYRKTIYSGELRDAILDRMRSLVPFLDNYLKVIHSPFDGFGPIDLTGKAKGSAPSAPHKEEILTWRLSQPSGLGTLGPENLHHRTGIRGLLLAGSQVVSGLGVEGELLAAWGAARIAGKTDKRRERLVRSMRSKVEM